ncbi:MAG TPA: DUF6132 family protein [Chitinophagales bacterium]|jgi:phage shock protein E|nr:hypothetical protein [Chitinophagales bacterium]MBP6153280.1 hypothetical protein [Chitinophagales bacterium]HQV78460.1 DUF6132 family protein [Chitinophagales bacterium]HQW78854.1 DUF6132 family protein [Chitinophagales bacterium]HRB67103.1 DUF6132 family protein [Chitinophagales bacterium]
MRNKILITIGVLLGAILGFLYWKFVGCASGTCAITSKPLNSTIYGAVMGGLLFSLFEKKTKVES